MGERVLGFRQQLSKRSAWFLTHLDSISDKDPREGGGLQRVCPALAIIGALARMIGTLKLVPCVGASSASVSVRTPGLSYDRTIL